MGTNIRIDLNEFGEFLETTSGLEFQKALLKRRNQDFMTPLAECKFVRLEILKEIVRIIKTQGGPDILGIGAYPVLKCVANNLNADDECLEEVLEYAIHELGQTPIISEAYGKVKSKDYVDLIIIIKAALKNANINDELLININETCDNAEVKELVCEEIIKRYKKLISQKNTNA